MWNELFAHVPYPALPSWFVHVQAPSICMGATDKLGGRLWTSMDYSGLGGATGGPLCFSRPLAGAFFSGADASGDCLFEQHI